jgi:alanine racemase
MPNMGHAGGKVTIDLQALAENYRLIAGQIGKARLAAVVKANAYGLGADRVAPALTAAGCEHYFVALLSEAMALKPHVPADAKIYVLNGLAEGAEAICTDAHIIPVINSLNQAYRWAELATARDQRLAAAIQFDTGMSRLGLPIDALEELANNPDLSSPIEPVLIMSHLACADVPTDPANAEQLANFQRGAGLFPDVPTSLSNSGGAFLDAAFHSDIVRAGVSLYGGAPNMDRPNPMNAVVGLQARVVQIRSVDVGAGVGYGYSYRCDTPSRIATISVGYADGLPRSLSNRGAAWYQGRRLRFVGRVSMDSITLDVTAITDGSLKEGDWVEILGAQQSLDDLANAAGTISYEILTSLGGRYDREYK